MENKEKAAASRLIKKYSIILILIALMIVLTMIKPQFIKPGNLVNMLRQISLVGILTMGMMLVILIGDIDIKLLPLPLIGCLNIQADYSKSLFRRNMSVRTYI